MIADGTDRGDDLLRLCECALCDCVTIMHLRKTASTTHMAFAGMVLELMPW